MKYVAIYVGNDGKIGRTIECTSHEDAIEACVMLADENDMPQTVTDSLVMREALEETLCYFKDEASVQIGGLESPETNILNLNELDPIGGIGDVVTGVDGDAIKTLLASQPTCGGRELDSGEAADRDEQIRKFTPPLDEIELACGGALEAPDIDGAIRYIDCNGNCEDIRRPDDDNYDEWYQLFQE